jgi:hypothetical protein
MKLQGSPLELKRGSNKTYSVLFSICNEWICTLQIHKKLQSVYIKYDKEIFCIDLSALKPGRAVSDLFMYGYDAKNFVVIK